MKKHLSLVAAILLAGITAVGCLEERESYFTPEDIFLAFTLKTADGNNLLDSTYVDNWCDSAIYCTFKDEVYYADSVDTDAEKVASSTSNFIGLAKTSYYDRSSGSITPVLFFGYLNGVTAFDDDLVLHWPGGKTTSVHLHNEFEPAKSQPGAVVSLVRYIVVDGEYPNYLPIELVLTE